MKSESDMPSCLQKNSEWLVVTVITFLVFVVQASWAVVNASGPSVFLDELLYKINAEAIFDLSKYPSTQYPPAYSITLAPALLFKNWFEAMLVINAFFCSMLVPASWLLARSVGLRHPLLAAMLTALLPMQAIYPHYIMSENLFVPLFVLSTALALRVESKRGPWAALLFGFILGLTHLSKYLFLPAVPLLIAVWLFAHHQEQQQQSSLTKSLLTCFLQLICILLTYSLTFGAWLYYGQVSGFALNKLLGLGHLGAKADAASLDSLLMWVAAYTSYVVLAWCPVWALFAVWIIQLRDRRCRHQVKAGHWRFLILLSMLLAGYWLLATQHSFGAPYNYPIPQYILGRYVMHLSPLMIILGVWILEQFSEQPKPPRLRSGLLYAGIVCGFAVLASRILFHQSIWPFPNWFATINCNSVDVLAQSRPLIFGASLVVAILPLALIQFHKISVRWLVLPLVLLMLASTLSNMLRFSGSGGSIHAREAAVAVSKLAKTRVEPIHIVLDNKHLALSSFENGLRFWGLTDEQFSAQVISTNTYPDFPASTLLITTRSFEAPLLHEYNGERQQKYYVYQKTDQELTAARPRILNFGPKTVEAGKAFNVQQSGNSAIWLKVQYASSRSYITIDDYKLDLIFGKNGFASTAIPKEVTAVTRTAQLRLHDPDTDLTSDALPFRILPPSNEIP